jgi:hypothetical protein
MRRGLFSSPKRERRTKEASSDLFMPGGLIGRQYEPSPGLLNGATSSVPLASKPPTVPPLALPTPVDDAATVRLTFVSRAVSALRNMWLIDGKRALPHDSRLEMPSGPSTPSSDSGGTHRDTSRSTASEELLPAMALPMTVIKGLHEKKIVPLSAWLELGGSPLALCGLGCTALHYAVLAPFPAAVELLISAGVELDARTELEKGGNTALLIAAIRSHTGVVLQLLEAGADPDLPDTDGHTPLMVASRAGDVEMVRRLLRHGACTELCDKDTRTALWYAVKYEQKGCAILLRQARQVAVDEGRIVEAKSKAARAKAELRTRNGNHFRGNGAPAAAAAIDGGDVSGAHDVDPTVAVPSPAASPKTGKKSGGKPAASGAGSSKKNKGNGSKAKSRPIEYI